MIYRNKMPRLTRLCWELKRFRIKFNVKQKSEKQRTLDKTKIKFEVRLKNANSFSKKLTQSISKKKNKSTTLYSAWSTKIEKWPESKILNNNKLKLIWFYLSMRKELYNAVNKKWKHLKMKWSDNMQNNNSNAWIKYKPRKTRLKKYVMQFSKN